MNGAGKVMLNAKMNNCLLCMNSEEASKFLSFFVYNLNNEEELCGMPWMNMKK